MATNDCNQILDPDDANTVLAALDPFHVEHGMRHCYDFTEGVITIEDGTRLTTERLAAIRDALPMGWEADWDPGEDGRACTGDGECEVRDILLVNVGAIADTLVRGLNVEQRGVLVRALERACMTMGDDGDGPADLRIRGVLEHMRPHVRS